MGKTLVKVQGSSDILINGNPLGVDRVTDTPYIYSLLFPRPNMQPIMITEWAYVNATYRTPYTWKYLFILPPELMDRHYGGTSWRKKGWTSVFLWYYNLPRKEEEMAKDPLKVLLTSNTTPSAFSVWNDTLTSFKATFGFTPVRRQKGGW